MVFAFFNTLLTALVGEFTDPTTHCCFHSCVSLFCIWQISLKKKKVNNFPIPGYQPIVKGREFSSYLQTIQYVNLHYKTKVKAFQGKKPVRMKLTKIIINYQIRHVMYFGKTIASDWSYYISVFELVTFQMFCVLINHIFRNNVGWEAKLKLQNCCTLCCLMGVNYGQQIKNKKLKFRTRKECS